MADSIGHTGNDDVVESRSPQASTMLYNLRGLPARLVVLTPVRIYICAHEILRMFQSGSFRFRLDGHELVLTGVDLMHTVGHERLPYTLRWPCEQEK